MKADTFRHKVLETITAHQLLCAGDTVLCALSGGADSITLLSVLCALKEELGLKAVAALHVNHGLRGEESERDEAFVRRFCEEQGVALTVFRRDVLRLAKERGNGVEEAGRMVRYTCFEEARGEDPSVKVATAHTGSDQAETVLMNLLRGCGTNGFAGIPLRRGAVVRPLLRCSREEIEAYCAETNLPYVTDSTNTDPAYRRNFVRGTVLPQLKQLNPKVEEAICRAASYAAEDNAFLQALAQEKAEEALAEVDTYHAKLLRSLPRPLLCRVLQQSAAKYGADPEATHLQTLAKWIKEEASGTLMLPGGVCADVTSHRVGFAVTGDTLCETPLSVGQIFSAGGRTYRLCLSTDPILENLKKVHRKLVIYPLDCDKIIGSLTVSARRSGDRLCVNGKQREQELRHLVSEKHLLPALRPYLPVIRDQEGVVLAVGVGCAARVACTEQTHNCIVLLEERK